MSEKIKTDSERLQEIEKALEVLFGITDTHEVTLTALETIHSGYIWILKPSILIKDHEHLQQLKKHLKVLGFNVRFPMR